MFKRLGEIVLVPSLVGAISCALWLPSWARRDGPRPAAPLGVMRPSGLALRGPESVSLAVSRGEAGGTRMTLRNEGREVLRLSRFETSCDCVSVPSPPLEFGPGAEHEVAVTFDPKHDPTFQGSLGVIVIGRDRADREIFRGRVDVEVNSAGAGR